MTDLRALAREEAERIAPLRLSPDCIEPYVYYCTQEQVEAAILRGMRAAVESCLGLCRCCGNYCCNLHRAMAELDAPTEEK